MAVAASSPPSSFFTLAAFELENHSPLPTPLDATAIAAGTWTCWNADSHVKQARFGRAFRGARRFPWPPLRHPLRPGARKLASTNDALPQSFGMEHLIVRVPEH